MTPSRGSLDIGRVFGAPVRVHWTAPLGALVFGRFELVPAFWLAFLGLILAHEIGHAVVVRAVRGRVRALDVNGAGGLCHWSGDVTAMQRAAIAWGGVLAQAIILVIAVGYALFLGRGTTSFGQQIWNATTSANLWLIALNLIPVAPLDGAEAWRIVPLLRARHRLRRAAADRRRSSVARARAEERKLDALDDDDAASAAADALAQRMIEAATKGTRRTPR